MTKALIAGITGQDGWYLAHHLHDQGVEVWGTSRTGQSPEALDFVRSMHAWDLQAPTEQIARILTGVQPDSIYHLAAQSSVPASWNNPISTAEITGLGTLRLLEAVRENAASTRVFIASSSEIFGIPSSSPQDEATPVAPVTPYGAAKAFALHMAQMYRERYSLFISSGILFNHESPIRPESYVSRKISKGVAEIVHGRRTTIQLGNLESRRDWGFAGDFVRAMQLMLNADQPDDYVIATGESHSVRDFCEVAFARVGLDYREHVEIDPELIRPIEAGARVGSPSRATSRLGWKPSLSFTELVHLMVDADLEGVSGQSEAR